MNPTTPIVDVIGAKMLSQINSAVFKISNNIHIVPIMNMNMNICELSLQPSYNGDAKDSKLWSKLYRK